MIANCTTEYCGICTVLIKQFAKTENKRNYGAFKELKRKSNKLAILVILWFNKTRNEADPRDNCDIFYRIHD